MTDVILEFFKLRLVLGQYTARPILPAVQNQKAASAHLYRGQILSSGFALQNRII